MLKYPLHLSCWNLSFLSLQTTTLSPLLKNNCSCPPSSTALLKPTNSCTRSHSLNQAGASLIPYYILRTIDISHKTLGVILHERKQCSPSSVQLIVRNPSYLTQLRRLSNSHLSYFDPTQLDQEIVRNIPLLCLRLVDCLILINRM